MKTLLKKVLVIAVTGLMISGCGGTNPPSRLVEAPDTETTITDTSTDTSTVTTTETTILPAPGTTYTLEPFDMDGSMGVSMTVTQSQLGGTHCPCVKVPYVANALPGDVQKGADNIWKLIQKGTIKSGDTVMGFSLGSQVIALFLSQHAHEIPAGIKFLLLGMTFTRNQQLLDNPSPVLFGTAGIPWDIVNEVTFVANEFDGYSDQPDVKSAPGYSMAVQNANAGQNAVHNYIYARLEDPANVVTKRGNITAILIPNQHLPQNNWMRPWNNKGADSADASQRAKIEAAYSGQRPTAAQLAAATSQQVPQPIPAIPQTPEPVADVS